MELVIPDGSRVCIVIGPEPLALPDAFVEERCPATERSERVPSRLGHSILKSVAVGALVLVAFVAGERIGGHGGSQLAFAQPRQALASIPRYVPPLPAQEQQAFPAAPLPPSAAPAPGAAPPRVPPQFARQLKQAPVVVPPPGQPASGTAPKNPFGLEN